MCVRWIIKSLSLLPKVLSSSAGHHSELAVEDELVSGQQEQRLEKGPTEQRRRRRRQVLTVVQVFLALDHCQLLENRGVFSVKRLHVDVVSADSHKG